MKFFEWTNLVAHLDKLLKNKKGKKKRKQKGGEGHMGRQTGPAACTTAPLAGPAMPGRLLAPAWAGWLGHMRPRGSAPAAPGRIRGHRSLDRRPLGHRSMDQSSDRPSRLHAPAALMEIDRPLPRITCRRRLGLGNVAHTPRQP
jgi:hypothetical protein